MSAWPFPSSLTPMYARSARGGSRPLLLPHLRKRQSCAGRDYIEYGMPRVGWQAQRVNSLPRSNADVRRIEIGALLSQLLASLFRALKFFVSEAFDRGRNQVVGAGRRHASSVRLSSGAGRLGPHPIARDPGPR